MKQLLLTLIVFVIVCSNAFSQTQIEVDQQALEAQREITVNNYVQEHVDLNESHQSLTELVQSHEMPSRAVSGGIEYSEDPSVFDMFKGTTWTFEFTIISDFSETYYFDDAPTVMSDGSVVLGVEDIYGNTSLMTYILSGAPTVASKCGITQPMYSFIKSGTIIDKFYFFVPIGDALIYGGYIQKNVAAGSYSDPYFLSGYNNSPEEEEEELIYFPHVSTKSPWQTEIALINTNNTQTVTGTLDGFNNSGQLIETKNIILSPRGRRQITIANDFVNHPSIGYLVFNADKTGLQGYTKFFQGGNYRTAIPAVTDVNTSDVYISHIASNDSFWTGISLVNTTTATKKLTINFNDGRSAVVTIGAGEHKIFTIAGLFGGQPQPSIKSGIITNANGIIGLELFGNDAQLDGLLLTDDTVSTIYYPHVADINTWWTGIVAYNPSTSGCNITITPYSETGTALPTSIIPIAGKEKYIGVVKNLGLDAQTAWFKIDSTRPLSGFELFGTLDGNLLAAYAEGSGTGAKNGVFAKIEKSGWTGIAFVNTEAGTASVTLKAYNDNGTAIATSNINVGGYAKVVDMVETIFAPQNINNATYVTFASDKNVVGFQLNGSSDGKMLDGLPALKTGQ